MTTRELQRLVEGSGPEAQCREIQGATQVETVAAQAAPSTTDSLVVLMRQGDHDEQDARSSHAGR